MVQESVELFCHGKTERGVMVGNMKESQCLWKNLEWSKDKIHVPARRAISEVTLLLKLPVFSPVSDEAPTAQSFLLQQLHTKIWHNHNPRP